MVHREILINWYLGRGIEKRFSKDDIDIFEKKYNLQKCGLYLSDKFTLKNHEDLVCLRFYKS